MCADNLIDEEAFMRKLLATVHDHKLTLMRIIAVVVFFLHGSQKMLGWFGGFGFSGTMTFFTSQMHTPAVFAFLAIRAEFFGSLGLIVGSLVRIAAFGIAVAMLVAVLMHFANGPFVNCLGNQKGEGYEYHLLALAVAIPIMIRGAGAFSLDGALAARGQGT
jgi:putative oxidoreductase